MPETKTIKLFSNAEVLALNSIGKVIDNYSNNVKLSVSEHKLCQQVIFEALRQLDEHELLKCTLDELFD
tara:strand:+ start:1788 stop:1994 length:207 start_codon:yes stop_codon:yes gene_type:complete